ncbi:H/ACA ribonucleoprotein complex subunit 3 [Dendroctonus ponderosae]
MYLMYYIDDTGKRVYTLQKVGPKGVPTESAHPARFSPEDSYSKPRIIIKTRFGILKTQTPEPAY